MAESSRTSPRSVSPWPSSRSVTIFTGVSKKWASCHPLKSARLMPCERRPELQNRVQSTRAGTLLRSCHSPPRTLGHKRAPSVHFFAVNGPLRSLRPSHPTGDANYSGLEFKCAASTGAHIHEKELKSVSNKKYKLWSFQICRIAECNQRAES